MIENVYLTIFLVIALAFLDFFLTIKSVQLARQGYSKHFKVESYELNPLFKKSVNKLEYSFKHFLLVIFTSAVVYAFYYLGKNNIFFKMNNYWMFQGMLFSLFIIINASHLRNLMVFKLIKQDSSLLAGKIKQKHLFSLKSSSADALKVFIILMAFFLFSPSYFNFGFALGPLLLIWKHRSWIKKHLKEKK